MRNDGWPTSRRSNCTVRRRRARAISARSDTALSAAASSAVIAHPRVEPAIEDVNGEIDEDEGAGRDQQPALDDGEVAALDGANDQPAAAGEREYRLDHYRARQQHAGGQTYHGDDRHQCIAQGM